VVLVVRERLRIMVLRYVEVPGARLLSFLGLTPNYVSLIGFAISVGAAVLVASGFLLAGGLIFLGGCLFDLLDGALARLQGSASRFGAMLDSTLDRLGEGVLFLALAVYCVRSDYTQRDTLVFIVALVTALVASQTVTYLRARGEALGIDTRGGIMTRPERVVILSIGLILGGGWVDGSLITIATFSIITLFHRLLLIKSNLKGG